MQKRINVGTVSMLLAGAYVAARREAPSFFESLAEDPDGPLVSDEQFYDIIEDVFQYAKDKVETLTGELPEPEEDTGPETPVSSVYEKVYHHTQTDGPDGGQSLVLCPGQPKFDYCTVDGHKLKYHRKDEDDRHSYWNMDKYYDADIVCVKDGRKYIFPADKNAKRGMIFGDCYGSEEPKE